MSRRAAWVLLSVAVSVLVLPQAAEACATCFGDPEAPMSKGVNRAVWFMIAAVGLVQVGIVKVVFDIRRRSKKINDPTELRMVRRGKE